MFVDVSLHHHNLAIDEILADGTNSKFTERRSMQIMHARQFFLSHTYTYVLIKKRATRFIARACSSFRIYARSGFAGNSRFLETEIFEASSEEMNLKAELEVAGLEGRRDVRSCEVTAVVVRISFFSLSHTLYLLPSDFQIFIFSYRPLANASATSRFGAAAATTIAIPVVVRGCNGLRGNAVTLISL